MKLNENQKERLPETILTSLISDGWEKVGILRDQVNAMTDAYEGAEAAASALRALEDAYLICIGQLEAQLDSHSDIKIPETTEPAIAEEEVIEEEPVEEALAEDLTVNIEEVNIIKPEVEIEKSKEEVSNEITGCVEGEDCAAEEVCSDEECHEEPEAAIEAPAEEFFEEEEKSDVEKLNEVKKACGSELCEAFEYFLDEFPEPLPGIELPE